MKNRPKTAQKFIFSIPTPEWAILEGGRFLEVGRIFNSLFWKTLC
jgi:hypothetical protein